MNEALTIMGEFTPSPEKLTLTVQGHKVTLSFAAEANHTVSELIKKALLGSYLQKAH